MAPAVTGDASADLPMLDAVVIDAMLTSGPPWAGSMRRGARASAQGRRFGLDTDRIEIGHGASKHAGAGGANDDPGA
jgi:hypothetical protein